jgi:hypothetical protein
MLCTIRRCLQAGVTQSRSKAPSYCMYVRYQDPERNIKGNEFPRYQSPGQGWETAWCVTCHLSEQDRVWCLDLGPRMHYNEHMTCRSCSARRVGMTEDMSAYFRGQTSRSELSGASSAAGSRTSLCVQSPYLTGSHCTGYGWVTTALYSYGCCPTRCIRCYQTQAMYMYTCSAWLRASRLWPL